MTVPLEIPPSSFFESVLEVSLVVVEKTTRPLLYLVEGVAVSKASVLTVSDRDTDADTGSDFDSADRDDDDEVPEDEGVYTSLLRGLIPEGQQPLYLRRPPR
ncbi:hypothetical protein DL89DRAFT_263487 [Linderina pennispora]|uniref:Uncharacterized protein n=1 Tax=Linderina pennispora TaxID=61395 RepID=A0A1Y1VRN2_9FUNG|nr:uncharacterized protein DL89DRAFT_263487 [Linderina pennispora]ORX63424.1 hypothetical protein DL89DRAFT_263487 [Linderina pennispora]